MHIAKATKGRYAKPIPISDIPQLQWINESEEPCEAPEKYPCDHPDHWLWGKGRRNGQKLYYPTQEMYYQKWDLSEEDFNEALETYDILSLDMPPRIICKNCMEKATKLNQPSYNTTP